MRLVELTQTLSHQQDPFLDEVFGKRCRDHGAVDSS
jgi:hypothetical protein